METSDQPSATKASGTTIISVLDLTAKFIAIMIALLTAYKLSLAAYDAAHAYQKEVNSKILDQRIKVFNDALAAGAKLLIDSKQSTFEDDLAAFRVVKHGEVIAFFGDQGEPYVSIVKFYNKAFDIGDDDDVDWSHFDETDQYNELDDDYEKFAKCFEKVIHVEQ